MEIVTTHSETVTPVALKKLWGDEDELFFECPGCKMPHSVNVNTDRRPCWTFNGDMQMPTFKPSILVRWEYGYPPIDHRCHSFIQDGHILFLNDCTHTLAGQRVPIPDWDHDW